MVSALAWAARLTSGRSAAQPRIRRTEKVADAIEITESNPRNCTKLGELSAVVRRPLRPAIRYSQCACSGRRA
jgi:hypothetical protein